MYFIYGFWVYVLWIFYASLASIRRPLLGRCHVALARKWYGDDPYEIYIVCVVPNGVCSARPQKKRFHFLFCVSGTHNLHPTLHTQSFHSIFNEQSSTVKVNCEFARANRKPKPMKCFDIINNRNIVPDVKRHSILLEIESFITLIRRNLNGWDLFNARTISSSSSLFRLCEDVDDMWRKRISLISFFFFRFLKNVARAEKTRRLNEKEEPTRHKNAVSTASRLPSRLPINAN